MAAEFTGHLIIDIDHSRAELDLQGREIVANFSSLNGLRKFHRAFQEHVLGNLSPKHPLRDLIRGLEIKYYLHHQLIGISGPHVKPTWWTKFLGMGPLQIDLWALIKGLFNRN